MAEAKLIKIFKKKSWKEFVMFHGSVLTLFAFLPIYFPTVFALDIFVALFFVSSTAGSVIKVYKDYLICYNPIYFWKPKKLFYFNKIEKIIISYRDSEYGSLQTLQIHHVNGKEFEYGIRSSQVDEFKNILLNLGVRVTVENYRVF